MNTERIRQLAKQAGISWKDQAELGVWTAFDCELEQFAQLIVQECAEFVGQQRNDIPANGWEFEAAIRQHFGVGQRLTD